MTFLELFRVLSSFSPRRTDLSAAPWEAYTDWAIASGLGPLAAYNLEYRLGQCGAPQWARDRLLSVYQGTANDTVMRLVNFKHVVGALEGRRVILVGGASFAEGLYPNVAFRPVVDLRVAVLPQDVDPLSAYLRRAEFRADEDARDVAGAQRVLTDTRTVVYVHGALTADAALHRALVDRAVPFRAFGPSVYRLDVEDALVVHALLLARAGFHVPVVELVDLRELVLGASSVGGPYARPVEPGRLADLARAWRVERALYAALSIVARLFPETQAAVDPLVPSLSFPVREAVDRLVVDPLSEVGRQRELKGLDAVRAALL